MKSSLILKIASIGKESSIRKTKLKNTDMANNFLSMWKDKKCDRSL